MVTLRAYEASIGNGRTMHAVLTEDLRELKAAGHPVLKTQCGQFAYIDRVYSTGFENPDAPTRRCVRCVDKVMRRRIEGQEIVKPERPAIPTITIVDPEPPTMNLEGRLEQVLGLIDRGQAQGFSAQEPVVMTEDRGREMATSHVTVKGRRYEITLQEVGW